MSAAPNLGVQSAGATQTRRVADRVYSVAVLRGVIVVIMALDHVRDYFTNFPFSPEDLAHTWPALFFTRWITHFCAPRFCFLAGTGAYLATSRGKSPSQVRNLLWKRGVWLIVLGWVSMWIIFPLWVGIYSVLWMFGWSMIALSAMVKLPLKWIAAMGAALMFLHNLADPIKPAQFGHLAWLWTLLHVPGRIGPFPPHLLFGRIPINSFYS